MTIETHFQYKDILNLIIGLVFVITSVILFFKGQIKFSILFLSTGGFILRFFIIKLDPFIYTWDEQFHALVAKNILTNPFKPMLYTNPVLPYDINNWTSNNVWFHKGPVFLWFIAISFKLFGINEIALRLPSILLSTLMIPLLFRMGELIADNRVGYFAALLFATANYQLEIVTGIMGSDHNDVAFMFFICASFWAWFEYQNSGRKVWFILIGLFSGLAVDTKWVMGFLIFFCWILTTILDKAKRKQINSYLDLAKSAMIAFTVSASWYIYALIRFHVEMSETLKGYSEHFSAVVENHSGNAFVYLGLLGMQYGWICPFVLLPALYFLYKRLNKKSEFKILLFTWLLFVEIFYAIAHTKMQLFTIILAPVIYFALGNFVSVTIEYLTTGIKRYSMILMVLLVSFMGFSNIGISEIEGHHTDTGVMAVSRERYIHNSSIFKNVATSLPQKDYVIFNCENFNAVQVMFYTGMTAYNNVPDKGICDSLEKSGIKIAVFNDGNLPMYMLNDTKIIKLNYTIVTYKPSVE